MLQNYYKCNTNVILNFCYKAFFFGKIRPIFGVIIVEVYIYCDEVATLITYVKHDLREVLEEFI